MYLNLLNKYQQQYGFTLFGHCFTSNSLSLLIELKEGLNVSDIMHDLSTNYTKYFNGKYARKGHLFKERYDLVVAEKAQYLAPIMEHMRKRADSVERRADSLNDIRYSVSADFNKPGILGSEEFISRVNKEMRKIEAASRPKTPRKFVYVSGVVIALLVGINFYIYGRMINERLEARKKYQAEMDLYYRDMAKKLQLEKQKARFLEERLVGEARIK